MGQDNRAANHYETLGISAGATQAEVKQAYRKLAKQFHPDSQNQAAAHDRIAAINAAYEVLGDIQERRQYDAERQLLVEMAASKRAARTVDSHNQYRRRRASKPADTTIEQWLRSVFNPTDRLIGQILKPLKAEVRALSADPFDDELMAAFQAYIETCREALEQAKSKFRSMPNPSGVASGAANLYYCLNQLEDGIEEIERFTYTYDDSYLHDGQELFRISAGLRKDAKAEIKAVL
ncbi:J domain-containing protein [Leptolyngbya sp. BC1307]|uniref:J domain-containing protein n=1 Tax=Leptolyngbya sp. BC1307 TaxID=2029589 RepID=UPI000EFB1815|nr:J domain-containing protein [Leptolyngbya sp. BC1307]